MPPIPVPLLPAVQPWPLLLAARSPHDERVRHLGSHRYPDALGLEIFYDHFLAALAAYAATLIAAERRKITHRPISVDPDGAGLQTLGHHEGAAHALRPDTGGQPEDDIVADGNRVFFVLEGNDRQHRPEHFFLGDAHAVLHPGEDRRLDEIAAELLGPLAAEGSRRAFGLGNVEIFEHLL